MIRKAFKAVLAYAIIRAKFGTWLISRLIRENFMVIAKKRKAEQSTVYISLVVGRSSHAEFTRENAKFGGFRPTLLNGFRAPKTIYII